MVVGGSRQETLDSGFVLLGTRQQGVPVILRELVLPGGFDSGSRDLLEEEGTTIEDNWKGIKEALTFTCQEVLGHKRHHHKGRISMETLGKIDERKNKKTAVNNSQTRAEEVKAQDEYTVANKQVKRSIRADKQKYVDC
ncbi:unnamed protein product [Schistosoma curassoni]|uniref:Uncharacterized protein n=1 Tax=Schistosoma curassoni TaxID=6186 RepID=A0A183JE64_9TREM|nr:unnamed protein product [Schistosoma curassoni]